MPTSKAKDKNQSKQASTAKLDSVDSSTTNSVENSVPVDHSVSEADSSVPSETTLPRDGESGNVDVEIAQGRLQESSAVAVDVGGGLPSDSDLAQEFGKKNQVRKYVLLSVFVVCYRLLVMEQVKSERSNVMHGFDV